MSELGERVLTQAAFQQAPASAIDDLVLLAAAETGARPVRLAIACRRRPIFTRGNAKTKELFVSLVRADIHADEPSENEERIAIAVSGNQGGAREVAELAGLARNQVESAAYFALINGPGQHSTKLRSRLSHLRDLVKNALQAIDLPDATGEERCWSMLRRLYVLSPAVEPSNDSDWVALADLLKPWSVHGTAGSAIALRNELEVLAGEFAQTAAAVDSSTVRRRLHTFIHPTAHRTSVGWKRLMLLDQEAREGVLRTLIGSGAKDELRLERTEVRTTLATVLQEGNGDLVVRGESGVGKSAVVLDATEQPTLDDNTQALTINLRDLPDTPLEVMNALCDPLEELLGGMTASRRLLIVDGAEAAAETKKEVFGYLLRSARKSGVTVIAIAAEAAVRLVLEEMKAGGIAVKEFVVPPLLDEEISVAVRHFPELERLGNNPKGRELLRRPIVIDLLARAGGNGVPLSDADALEIVWQELVRNSERPEAGLPDAREQAMLNLATHSLHVETSLIALDPAAVVGLRQDGLLRRGGPLPWEREPTFAHDLIREYAVARVLVVTKDPASELRKFNAPRWSLPAARLACQLLLTSSDASDDPRDFFQRLQTGFDALAASGCGERWVDVPTEALVATADPVTALTSIWQFLLEDDAKGLRRLIRVLDLRHRKNGFIDTIVADPVIAQLVKEKTPTRLREETSELINDWLVAHVIRRTPVGHPARVALAKEIVDQCKESEREADRRDAEAAAARAARSPEEIAAEEEQIKKFAAFTDIGLPRRKRRVPKRRRPHEWIDNSAISHLALMGRDLESEGEAILRRIAEDEPHSLAPAVETMFAGQALGDFNPQLLVDLTEAYYVDEEHDDDGFGYSGIHDEGIRHHTFGGLGPLAAYYKGPFIAMFRNNYRGGVACLNRMLNHAARHRARTLANIGYPNVDLDEEERYKEELSLVGERRTYIGDGQVWFWYRGTGGGPYPCMSALQALELVSDEFIRAGVPVTQLVPILLEDSESLAMPALVLGMLVRHLEASGDALFPFIVEPTVWELEFARHVHESGGLAAQVPELEKPERRSWSLRHVCMMLALQAEGERIERLRKLGNQLIEAATAQVADDDSQGAREHLAAVKNWAASLDRSAYEVTEQDGQLVIQQAIDPEIEAILGKTNVDLARGNDALGLTLRHVHKRDEEGGALEMSSEALAADIATAQSLLAEPPATGMGTSPDGPVSVAASAVELVFRRGIDVADSDLQWSGQVVLDVAASISEHPPQTFDGSFFSQGVDRSAARALPYMLLPAAAGLRAALELDSAEGVNLLVQLNEVVATAASNEARMSYARSLDAVWDAPCGSDLQGDCHHEVAFELVEKSFRDCILGSWDNELQERAIVTLIPSIISSLAGTEADRILVDRLSPGLRALGSAAISNACCREKAESGLEVVLAAHRGGMLAHEHGYFHSESDSLIAARAALWQATAKRDETLLQHIRDYLGNSRLLGEALRAVNAAAEERPEAAAEARRLWPAVIDLTLAAAATNPEMFTGRHWGDSALSELVPSPAYTFGYLTLELSGVPIKWRDLLAWSDQINRWLSLASGRQCIDALVVAVGEMEPSDQVELGLQWIEQIVQGSGNQCGNTYTLPEWIHERRGDLSTPEQEARWQRVVDQMVIAGDRRVADLAD